MRGKQAPKRKINADPMYSSLNVAKLINYVMYSGKKSTAQKIVYGAFEIIKEKTKKDPLEVFETALRNISPTLEVKSRRVGGANYQIPIQVRAERRTQLAYRWLLVAARGKKGQPMKEKLASELIAASDNTGEAVKKKADVQRMAEANRAFAPFAR